MTHAVFNFVTDTSGIKSEQFRMNTFRIAAKFQKVSYLKGYTEYLYVARNYFLKSMMDDPSEKFRIEAVNLVWIGQTNSLEDQIGL